MLKLNFDLNVTLKCNLKCNNCNRMCNYFPEREEHMSVAQVEKFVSQVREVGGINKLKVLGGEPLLHPNFKDIYYILTDAAKEGLFQSIKVDTNHTINTAQYERYNFTRWMGKSPRKKCHNPYVWNPKDYGFSNLIGPCHGVNRCGFSLDKYGFTPCSPAIMLVRLYGLNHLYKRELPTKFWGANEVCPLCISAAPQDFIAKHSKPLDKFTEEELTPSKSVKERLDKWNPEEFYKNQMEY